MSEANSYMHGGTHYQRGSFQHWDYVMACLEGRYLEGCFTKHVSRHRFKGVARLDLEKAPHYVVKLRESFAAGLTAPITQRRSLTELIRTRLCDIFIEEGQLNELEARICKLATCWETDQDLAIIGRHICELQAALRPEWG